MKKRFMILILVVAFGFMLIGATTSTTNAKVVPLSTNPSFNLDGRFGWGSNSVIIFSGEHPWDSGTFFLDVQLSGIIMGGSYQANLGIFMEVDEIPMFTFWQIYRLVFPTRTNIYDDGYLFRFVFSPPPQIQGNSFYTNYWDIDVNTSSLPFPPNPTAPVGYSFVGWYLDKAFTIPVLSIYSDSTVLYPRFVVSDLSSEDVNNIEAPRLPSWLIAILAVVGIIKFLFLLAILGKVIEKFKSNKARF